MSKLDTLIAIEKDARNYGFNWPDIETILKQVKSECDEILDAIQQNEPKNRIEEEISDLLHAAIGVCIFMDLDPNIAIQNIIEKFGLRMHLLKKLAKEKGLDTLSNQSFESMLDMWKIVKERSKDVGMS